MEAGFDPVALYAHVPFCMKKCAYCDFFSIPDAEEGMMRRVLDASVRELAYFVQTYDIRRFDTIYVGGGTPSCVPTSILSPYLEKLASAANGAREFTVEANPEGIDVTFLAALAASGVTRLSVGIQTLRDPILASIGRSVSGRKNIAALESIGGLWKGDLSLDMIAGLPGQTPEILLEDLSAVLAFLPAHISLYSLIVEEGTPLEKSVRNGSVRLPEKDEQDEIWIAGRDFLSDHGFRQYEVSNFARDGKECVHNEHYWDLDPYVGIGPGGISTLPGLSRSDEGFAPAPGGALRVINTSNCTRFSSAKGFGLLFENIAKADFQFEHFMMALRTVEGLDRELYVARFGEDPESYDEGVIERWKSRGLLSGTKKRLRMSAEGLMHLNEFLVELLG
jgi:oxygen-independent coproporphyrinogen III oxidase